MLKRYPVLKILCRLISGVKTPHKTIRLENSLPENCLFEHCQYHQIIAAVYHYHARLNTCFPTLSHHFFERAKAETIASLSQCMVYENFLTQFSEQLSDRNIPFRIFKGISLANEIYNPAYLRGYADLDLLIKPEDLNKLQDFLFQKGFQLSNDLYTHFPLDVVKKYAFARHYIRSRPTEIALDVHLNLSNRLHPFQFDPQEFWQNHKKIVINHKNYLTFQDEHNAIYLLYHCWKHYYFKLSWFIDLFKFLDQVPIDCHRYEQLLKKYNLSYLWRLYLFVCKRLFGRFPRYIKADLISHYYNPHAPKLINSNLILTGSFPYPFSVMRLILPWYYLHHPRQYTNYLIKQFLPPSDTIRKSYEQQTLPVNWFTYLKLRCKSLTNPFTATD